MITEAETGCTSLHGQLQGCEKLQGLMVEADTNSGYLCLENQPHEYLEVIDDSDQLDDATVCPAETGVYEEIPTLLTEAEDETEYSSTQSQYEGYLEVEHYSAYEPNDADSKKQEEEFGNSSKKTQTCGYVPVTEYISSSFPEEKAMHMDDKARNNSTKSQQYEYIPITEYIATYPPQPNRIIKQAESMYGKEEPEYSDTLPPPLQIIAKKPESTQTEEKSGNIPPESQPSGYVSITEYSDTPTEESMQREDEYGTSPSKSKPLGYVPITEYSDTFPLHFQGIAKQEQSIQLEEQSGNTSPMIKPFGFVSITEYTDILPPFLKELHNKQNLCTWKMNMEYLLQETYTDMYPLLNTLATFHHLI